MADEPVRRSAVAACPLDCPDACSWLVELEDGRPVKLRGNPDHPFTGAALCPKTMPYIEHCAHPDRLMHPLRRVGRKGAGSFARIGWDEALAEVAARLGAVIASDGAEAIWPYAGTGSVGWIQGLVGAGKRLFHHLGASRHVPTICSVAGHAGMSYSTGSAAGMEPEDLRHSALVILWGTNTLVSNRHLWPFIKQARAAGARMVVIDPVRTATAARADLHLPLWPGTDAALALAVMHRLAASGAVDAAYLAERALGWEEFRDQVLPDYAPERVAEICALPVADIVALAELIAGHRPTGIRCLMGMQRHGGGGQAARVLSCLPAVTGDYQRRGGGLCYSTGPCYPLAVDALCGTALQPRPTRALAMTQLGHNLLELDDPPIKALAMWGANPVVSNPDSNRVRRGLARDDLFFVAIDNFATDTADYADILLPGTMQLEHVDLHDSYSHLYLNWNEPLVEPPGECLSHTEIFRRLARHMGLDEPALYASDDELASAALAAEHPALQGITLAALKERGWLRMGWPRPFLPFAQGFPTASGKFEFSSQRGEADGVGRFPHFTPAHESGAGGGYVLLSPANKHLLNSIFANSPHHARAGDAAVVINPSDAAAAGVVEGDRVRLFNGRGEFSACLRVSDETRPGVLVTSKGHWPKLRGGPGVNATTAERDADMARGAVYHDNRVFLEIAVDGESNAVTQTRGRE